MSEPVHVLMKIKDQETFFDGKDYPHYEIGWKKGNNFYAWDHARIEEKDVESWEDI